MARRRLAALAPALAAVWARAAGEGEGKAAAAQCEVTFRNVGGSAFIPAEEGHRGKEVRVFAAARGRELEVLLPAEAELPGHWEAVRQAVGVENLRLARLPGPEEGWRGARKDAKLVELGGLSLWREGPAALRRRLRPGAPRPEGGRLLLRPDELVASVGPGQLPQWNATCGQLLELEADGAEAVLVTVRRDGEVVFAAQGGAVRALRTGAALRGPLDGGEVASWREVAESAREACRRPFAGRPADAEYFCGPGQDHRFYVTSRYDHSESHARAQLAANRERQAKRVREQPELVRHFTKEGFLRRKGPVEVIEKVRKFYLEERLTTSHPELGAFFNPTLSMYESDVWALRLPEELRGELDWALRPLVAEWAGLSPDSLESLTIHGPRLYHNGSVLHPHVDNLETHAFGVVVHLGHEGLRSEAVHWPLSILDHGGSVHVLPPDTVGEVVFYEGAAVRHWREGPFLGREFANLFLHYAPSGWPKAFLAAEAQAQEL